MPRGTFSGHEVLEAEVNHKQEGDSDSEMKALSVH